MKQNKSHGCPKSRRWLIYIQYWHFLSGLLIECNWFAPQGSDSFWLLWEFSKSNTRSSLTPTFHYLHFSFYKKIERLSKRVLQSTEKLIFPFTKTVLLRGKVLKILWVIPRGPSCLYKRDGIAALKKALHSAHIAHCSRKPHYVV